MSSQKARWESSGSEKVERIVGIWVSCEQRGWGFFLPSLSLATFHGMWDRSSPTKDGTHTPTVEEWSLNRWTASEVTGWAF